MLTVFNQPIQAPDRGEHSARSVESELAAIAAEIAERVEEMELLKLTSGGKFLARLASVRSISQVAFRITTQLLSGGDHTVLMSYAVQAEKRGVSRQTVFLEFHSSIERVRGIFPQLADAFDAAHAFALASEQPTTTAAAVSMANRDE